MPIEGADYMKNSTKVLLILLISLFIILISIIVYNKMKIQNIFDEIYYAGAGATNEPFEKPRSVLGNIPNMESQVHYESSISENGEKITVERYMENKLPDNMTNLSLTFYSKKKEMNINISYKMAPTVTLSISNKYDVSSKTISRTISFFDTEKKGDIHIKDKKDIQNYMDIYNISEAQINTWSEKGIKNILLEDWITVYPSKYSVKDLGNVKIKKFNN
jgi:hypothetical protein